jgi:small-conductance mechanosensitive channel
VLGVEKLVLIGYTLYLSYLVRGIPRSYNESRTQSWIFYNFFVAVIIVAFVLGFLNSSRSPSAGAQSTMVTVVALCYIVVVSVFLTIGLKFVYIGKERGAFSRGKSGKASADDSDLAKSLDELKTSLHSSMLDSNEGLVVQTVGSSKHGDPSDKRDSGKAGSDKKPTTLAEAKDAANNSTAKPLPKATAETLSQILQKNSSELKEATAEVERLQRRAVGVRRELEYVTALRCALVLDSEYETWLKKQGKLLPQSGSNSLPSSNSGTTKPDSQGSKHAIEMDNKV